MKKIKNTQKTNFFKKIFIKICRLLGYEIIDQSNFKSTSLNKDLANFFTSMKSSPMNNFETNTPLVLRISDEKLSISEHN